MKRLLLSLFLVALLPVVALAFPISLTQSNESSLSGLATFASVDVTISGNVATFVVDANPDGYLTELSNFGIKTFSFNTILTEIDTTDITIMGASNWTVTQNSNISSFGSFDFTNDGKGNSIQDPLIFTVTDSSISSPADFYAANSLGYHFATHIIDFSAPETTGFTGTSAWFADGKINVPEPGTMLLLGGLLFGLGAINRKRELK